MNTEENDSLEQPPERRAKSADARHPAHVVRVDGKAVEIRTDKPRGTDVLQGAGRIPVEAYVLIQLLEHSSRSISLDERVAIKGEGIELFRTFASDRILRLFVDDHSFDWGTDTISEADLREIAAVPEVFAIEQILPGGNRVLAAGEVVSLAGSGSERFQRVKNLVTVYLGQTPHQIPAGAYTTEQLIKILKVKPGYVLNLVKDDGTLVLLESHQKTTVVDGMRFMQQVPCGGSS